MSSREELKRCLKDLSEGGGKFLILVEDSAEDGEWRVLTNGEMRILCELLEDKGEEAEYLASRLGYNLEESAALVGVSVHKITSWINRSERPLPHIRDGRRIIVIFEMLKQWLREEAAHPAEDQKNKHR